jgi:hypothetical protein
MSESLLEIPFFHVVEAQMATHPCPLPRVAAWDGRHITCIVARLLMGPMLVCIAQKDGRMAKYTRNS